MLSIGTARTVVTPPIGTPLAGYGHRNHGAEEVLDDLEVRVIWFQTDVPGEFPLCIICADLIGFGSGLTQTIRTTLHRTCGISPDHILLSASHTHSGPQTCEDMHAVGASDPQVVAAIAQKIVDAALVAQMSQVPARLQYGQGHCEGFAVNRRLVQNGRATFAPNPSGVHDDTVSVISCIATDTGDVLAALFRYTCHPTTMGDYCITADYPGTARRRVEAQLGTGAVAAFLPGCFADIRPNCTYIGGRIFRRGQPEDVNEFGNALGDAVLDVLRSGALRELTPSLFACASEISLALKTQLGVNDTGIQPILSLQRIDLSHDLTIVALGGEICCDYSNSIKQLDLTRVVLPIGYSNGLVGYIPSAHMLSEGGYEVEEAGAYFSLPAPFTAAIESDVLAGVRSLLNASHSF